MSCDPLLGFFADRFLNFHSQNAGQNIIVHGQTPSHVEQIKHDKVSTARGTWRGGERVEKALRWLGDVSLPGQKDQCSARLA